MALGLSMHQMKRILNPANKKDPGDDFRIVDSWVENEKHGTKSELGYFCYELETVNPKTGVKAKVYKAVKFARVERLPKSAKQSTSLMDMQSQVLTAAYRENYNLITIIANVINPTPIGLMYLYGIQGVSGKNIEEAKRIANLDFKGFIGAMMGTFRVLQLRTVTSEEGAWLREKMRGMKFMTAIRGIPKASDTGEDAGNKGIGGSNLNPNSEGTLEEIITAMSDYEYVIEVLSAPVTRSVIESWTTRTQKDLTDWQGQMQGTKSLSMSISLPMTYMTSTGNSQGWSRGTSDSRSLSYSTGESYNTGYSRNVGESLSQSLGQSFGISKGTSVSQSQGTSHSLSQGLTRGQTVGETQGITRGQTYGQTVGRTEGLTRGVTQGVTKGSSEGISVSQTMGSSLGNSTGTNKGVSLGRNVGTSSSLGMSSGVSKSSSLSNSASMNLGSSYGQSLGQNLSKNYGDSSGLSHSVGSSQNASYGVSNGYNVGGSHSDGTSASAGRSGSQSISDGISSNSGISGSKSVSNGTSNSVSNGTSSSTSNSNSTSKNSGVSSNMGTSGQSGWNSGNNFGINMKGISAGTSSGVSGSNGLSSGMGISSGSGSSSSNGTSNGTSNSVGNGVSHSESASAGWSESQGQSHSVSNSEGWSASRGTSHSDGSSWGMSTGTSQSQGAGSSESYGLNRGASYSEGYGASYGQNSGLSYSNGTGVSQGTSVGSNNGMSASQGTSSGQSYGTSAGASSSQNVGQSYSVAISQNRSTSQSASMSQSISQSESVSQSQSQSDSLSRSYSQSASNSLSQSQSESAGTSESTSYGNTAGQSYTQSLSNGTGKSWGESNSVSSGQSYGESNGQSTGQTYGTSGGFTTGTSGSMGVGPSIGYTQSYQWLDQQVQDIVEILTYQNDRLKKAARQGAFYTYVYIACPDLDALAVAQAAAVATWQNSLALQQPIQALDLNDNEQQHLLYHFTAFSSDVTREKVNGVEDYKYATVLLPDEYVAYTHLPRVSEGGIDVNVEDIPKFRVPGLMRGNIYMGTQLNPERFTFRNGYKTEFDYRINIDELMHGVFTGQSRSGKTVAAMRFVRELANSRRTGTGKRLRIVIMDPKQDWRGMARFVEPERFRFYSLGNTTFRPISMNPCKIPYGVTPQHWIDGIINIYCRAYGLLERGKQMLSDVFYKLYQEAGCFKYEDMEKPETWRGGKGPCRAKDDPAVKKYARNIGKDEDWIWDWEAEVSQRSASVTFHKIYKDMEAVKNSLQSSNTRVGNDTMDAYSRLLERLSCFSRPFAIEYRLFSEEEAVTEGKSAFDDPKAVGKGLGVDELIGGDDVTVFESFGLESTFANFIFGIITSGFYKVAKGFEGGYLNEAQYETVLVIEEANKVLTGNDAAGTGGGGGGSVSLSGQSEFEEILDQSAGYGLFIVAITQKISMMPSSIVANCGLLFMGKLSNPDDVTLGVSMIGRDARIDDKDVVKFLPKCPTGWFIIRSNRGYDFRDAEAVLVAIAPLNNASVSNAELDEILMRRDVALALREDSATGLGARAAALV